MQNEEVKVWDLFVRIFHWTLVSSFFIAYLTEDEVMWLHELAGYTILFLVCGRVIWGFEGSKYARFSEFLYSPVTIIGYLNDTLAAKSKRYLGHNPLGGIMVIVLMIMVTLTSISGIKAEEGMPADSASLKIELIKSAHAHGGKKHRNKDDDDDRDVVSDRDRHEVENRDRYEEDEEHEFWAETHEVLANITLFLIFLHVAGVIFSSMSHRENLVRAMITGYKRKDE